MAFDLSSLFKSTSPKAATKVGVIGIDFGASSLKIVQLKSVKNIPTLETYGELQLGPYENSEIGRSTHLQLQNSIEALVDILREAGASAKDIAFAISYSSSFTSSIAVPTLDTAQIDAMLPIEARKYVPISLTKVSLDWILTGVDEVAKVSHILLSAIYNDAVLRYESMAKGAGLNLVGREIELFSAVRAVASPQDELIGVLDFGANATRLYIVEKGVIQKTHSTLLSGVALTQALQKGLTIKFEAAEELKRTVGLHGKEEDPRIQKIVVEGLERGLREIHTVLSRYEGHGGARVQRVVVSGGGAQLKGLSTYIGDMFSLPVQIADPFAKVAYPAFLEDTLKEAGPSFAVAVGVALKAFQNIND